jgi:hypothetical protein
MDFGIGIASGVDGGKAAPRAKATRPVRSSREMPVHGVQPVATDECAFP